MSSQLTNLIANRYDMLETCIQGYKTQADADALIRQLTGSDEIIEKFTVMQFASGWYFVVLVPRILR